MKLGARIWAWRKFKGLTQEALADAVTELAADLKIDVRVSGSAISYWESDVTKPSQTNLELVVQVFGVTMQRFYGNPPKAKRTAA